MVRYLLTMLLAFSPTAYSAVTEEEFQDVILSVQERLENHVAETYNHKFLVTGDWPKEYSPTSGGGSHYIKDGAWAVHVVGWVARYSSMTPDTLRLVYCHELGHHIYGMDAEEEADFFAAKECLPLAFQNEDRKEEYVLDAEDIATCAPLPNKNRCERVLSAANRANDFRAWVWKIHETSDEEIAELVRVRKELFRRGFLESTETVGK